MHWVAAGGLRVIEIPDAAKGCIAAPQARYLDRPLDVADATRPWAASSLDLPDILTIDEAGSPRIGRRPANGSEIASRCASETAFPYRIFG
jgi:hypothetical protein